MASTWCCGRLVVHGVRGPTVLNAGRRSLNTYTHSNLMPRLQLAGKVLPQLSQFTPGQLFIHKKFGYCGAVLSTWTAKCYEHLNGLAEVSPRPELGAELSVQRRKLVDVNQVVHNSMKVGTSQRFYTVVIDKQHLELIEPRLQSNVTYLRQSGDESEDNHIASVADCRVDYVEHDDIIPIELFELQDSKKPLFQSILDESPALFSVDRHRNANGHSVQLVPTGYLSDWLAARPRTVLQTQEVHFEVTAGFKVTVMPFYIGQQRSDGQHVWRYWLRVECIDSCGLGPAESATLHERHWRIAQLSVQDDYSCSSDPDMPVFRPICNDPARRGIFRSTSCLDHIFQGSGIIRQKKNWQCSLGLAENGGQRWRVVQLFCSANPTVSALARAQEEEERPSSVLMNGYASTIGC